MPLEEVCTVEYGTRVVQKRDGGNVYPVYGGGGATFKMDEFNREDRVVIARFGMSEECTRFVAGKFFLNDSGLTVSPKNGAMLQRLLDYQMLSLNDDIFALGKGTAQKNLDVPVFRTLSLYIPNDSEEQQRIVAILDKSFDAIAVAKANTEKNLQNTRAVFESRLQSIFTQQGKGWVNRQLASLCHDITVGHVGPMKTEYKGSGLPFLRSQNIRPFEVSMDNAMFIDEAFHRALKKSRLHPGDLAIVRTGYPGTAAVIPPELPDSNCSDLVIVRPSKEVNPHFLAAFFNSAFGKQLVLGKIVGAAQKHFNITAAKEVMLYVPPMPEQEAIVADVHKLREETGRLASLYKRKLAALEALKKSVLYQAFTGQLTKDSLEFTPERFPARTANITPIDLHAGILAMAYQSHEEVGKQTTFGHVKAEKIAHIVEARLELDLGRDPVKDAAGPNDFNHLKKVEHRAGKANYFHFGQSDGVAYRVQKLPGFGRLIEKVRTALGNRAKDVDRVLQWMLPMTAQQAEIVATVFAAWNNLLLDGKCPNDEQIVFEARENWHPDKLKIERQKFFAAVQWLRDQGVVPEGKGKRVADKLN